MPSTRGHTTWAQGGQRIAENEWVEVMNRITTTLLSSKEGSTNVKTVVFQKCFWEFWCVA